MNELEEAGLRLKLAAAEREREELKKQLQGWEANATYSINLGIAAATEKLTKERDSLAAKCAEMRRVLSVLKNEHDASFREAMEIGNSDGFSLYPSRLLDMVVSALSFDCGRDYVPRRQLDETRKELERMKSQTGSCSVCGNTVWSQEDDRGIAHCIVCALSAERDSLRAALKECVEALDHISVYPIHSEPAGGAMDMQRIADEALAKAKEALK